MKRFNLVNEVANGLTDEQVRELNYELSQDSDGIWYDKYIDEAKLKREKEIIADEELDDDEKAERIEELNEKATSEKRFDILTDEEFKEMIEEVKELIERL